MRDYMTNFKSISILHVILLAMTFIGLKNHVTIIPAILITVGRDGWMAVILGGILILPWLYLVYFIYKRINKQSIRFLLIDRFGRVFGNIFIYFIVIFLFILAAFTMRETLLWINTTFLPRTPTIALLFVFAISIILLISSNIETIAIVNVFVLFGVLVLGFMVAFINMPVKDHDLLRPFLEHGFFPVLGGSIFPASGYVELILLLFLHHQVKGKLKFKHFLLMLFLLVGLTVGPLNGAITEFGPTEAAKQRYPAYEEWGLATIGRFIEHLDFFSFYQWLTGAFIRIGIILYIIVQLLNIHANKPSIWKFVAIPFILLSLSLGLVEDSWFLNFHEREFLIVTFVFFFVLSLILLVAVTLPSKGVKKANDSE